MEQEDNGRGTGMSKLKFVLDRQGVNQLLKSPEVQSSLSSIADNIQSRAGAGYEKDIYVGKNRANSMVYADSIKAKVDNSKNNTLLKATRSIKI